MKNILVTGGAGFIGSTLVDKLLDNNRVIIYDNFDSFYSKSIKEKNIKEALKNSNCILIEGDIRDVLKLENVIIENKIDLIFHLAAKAGVRPSLENPQLYYDVNVTGTLNILEAMKKTGIKDLVFASSSSVYGNNKKAPFLESDIVDYPISPYASTKKSCELMCHVYAHLYNFNITCLRLFTVFGPRQRPDLAIHKFTMLIDNGKPIPFFGDGTTARDYTYVDDIVSGMLCAMNNLNGYHVYNLGESNLISLNVLLSSLEDALGKKAVLDIQNHQPGDVSLTFADINLAKNEIGYNPVFDFQTGLKNFVEWYRRN